MTGDDGTTRWPFADGSLTVYVDLTDQTSKLVSQNGLTVDPPRRRASPRPRPSRPPSTTRSADMPLDIGRVTHLTDQMHRSEDDAGDPIDTGFLLAADGARGHVWTDPSTLSTTGFLDWVLVTDPTYGAVGDDTTDDTTAIQDAIDATPQGGVCDFPLPASAYKITAALNIPRQMRLMGGGSYIGQYTKIRQATANTTAISNTGAFGLAMDVSRSRVQSRRASSGNALYTTGSLHISRCLFQGFILRPVRLPDRGDGRHAYFVNIEAGTIIDSATRDGVHLEGAVNNINVYGLEAGSNGVRHGLYAAGGPYSMRIIGRTSPGERHHEHHHRRNGRRPEHPRGPHHGQLLRLDVLCPDGGCVGSARHHPRLRRRHHRQLLRAVRRRRAVPRPLELR